jgi:hypothetical protein
VVQLILDAKRMLGRNWDDPVLQKYIKKQYWEFEVKPNENKQPQIMVCCFIDITQFYSSE